MKKLIALAAVYALILPPLSVYAEQAHHPKQPEVKGEMPAQGQPAMGGMMGKMQEHMKMMQHREAERPRHKYGRSP